MLHHLVQGLECRVWGSGFEGRVHEKAIAGVVPLDAWSAFELATQGSQIFPASLWKPDEFKAFHAFWKKIVFFRVRNACAVQNSFVICLELKTLKN